MDERAVDVVFRGLDRGVEGGREQHYERSLALADAQRDEVLLAYAMNGAPLPPAHGFPLRLIVPGWYGMASVKWLRSITAVAEPFEGVQQTLLYNFRRSADEPGERVTRQRPRSVMAPPGIPEFLSRVRHVRPGRNTVRGRAWSGQGPIHRVEFSADGGTTWTDARLEPAASRHGWAAWSYDWDAAPGEHELCVRATDAAGDSQPQQPDDGWNLSGYAVNAIQRVTVRVA